MEKQLRSMIEIQEMQFELDRLGKSRREVSKRIRSIAQKLPKAIRELKLK